MIGSVFVPLYAVAAVDFFVVSRQRWDVSTTSRLRVAPVIAWACGFVGLPAGLPRYRPWMGRLLDVARQRRIGFVPPGWLGSSVAAIAVSGFVMLVSGLLLRYRRVVRGVTASPIVSGVDVTRCAGVDPRIAASPRDIRR